MSFASMTASEDAEAEEGSSRGLPSFPSTSDGSLPQSSAAQSGRYPKSLSVSPSRQISPGGGRLETFDELLREAGYAHTRVLTPKAERLAKDAATYSARTISPSHADAVSSTQSTGYVTTVASFLAWLGGRSTTTSTALATQVPRPSGFNESAEETRPTEQESGVETSPSPTPHRRLQPKLDRCPSSNAASTIHLIPSTSSNATLTPSNIASSTVLRPKQRSRNASGNSRAIRHAISSPHLSGSPTSTTPVAATRTESEDNKQNGHAEAASRGRPRLLDTWYDRNVLHERIPPSPLQQTQSISSKSKNNSMSSRRQSIRTRPSLIHSGNATSSLPASLRTPERPKVPRLRPSEKLLARTGSLRNAKTRAGHTNPVTIFCRSSSVGNPSRSRRKQLPLLTPSGETSAWPCTREQRSPPLLPKINIHAANSSGIRPLARTGSASSAKAFSSYSRASGYTSLSRVGSAYTTISRSGTGTSAMASSSKLGYDESVLGEYGHSPTANGFRHLSPQQIIGESNDTDEDSENEPRLANILAPHVKSAGPRTEPVERRQSIRSLRACLQRHHSVSISGAPLVTSPASAVFPSIGLSSPNLMVSSPSHDLSRSHEEATTGGMIKRRSTGQSSTHRYGRRRSEVEHDDGSFDHHNQSFRRIEGAGEDDHVEERERGRSGTRGLLTLGISGIRWSSASSANTGRNSSNHGGSRASDRRRGKMTEREMERERLLWGTNWGRREMDRDAV